MLRKLRLRQKKWLSYKNEQFPQIFGRFAWEFVKTIHSQEKLLTNDTKTSVILLLGMENCYVATRSYFMIFKFVLPQNLLLSSIPTFKIYSLAWHFCKKLVLYLQSIHSI